MCIILRTHCRYKSGLGWLVGVSIGVGFPGYSDIHTQTHFCLASMMPSSNGNIFPRYWPFVLGIHRSPVNSPHKGQWRGALMFSLICTRINGWVNNGEAGDLRRHRAHNDVTVMRKSRTCISVTQRTCRPHPTNKNRLFLLGPPLLYA